MPPRQRQKTPAKKAAPKVVATAKPTTSPSRNVVARHAKTWSDEVLKCRLLGHSWDQYRAEHMIRFHYWHVRFRCERGCGVEKWEEWTENGIVTAKGMNYPRDDHGQPTYLLEGFGRVDADGRGVLRLESVGRTGFIDIEGDVETDPDNAPHSSITVQVLRENKLWPSS